MNCFLRQEDALHSNVSAFRGVSERNFLCRCYKVVVALLRYHTIPNCFFFFILRRGGVVVALRCDGGFPGSS